MYVTTKRMTLAQDTHSLSSAFPSRLVPCLSLRPRSYTFLDAEPQGAVLPPPQCRGTKAVERVNNQPESFRKVLDFNVRFRFSFVDRKFCVLLCRVCCCCHFTPVKGYIICER